MSKHNPLGLVGYGDSDDDSEEEVSRSLKSRRDLPTSRSVAVVQEDPTLVNYVNPAIQPPPVPHCAWSACYDESSGFTYYWNQFTNAVTWEAPPEYLLAVKLAQQQLTATGTTEVSAEEWQLYQQALAEKKAKGVAKPPPVTKAPPPDKSGSRKNARNGKMKKRKHDSDSEDDKIELITSYYHSDSESDTESSSKRQAAAPSVPPTPKPPKHTTKKQKIKPVEPVEYGPPLPPNQGYTVPIGPELPPDLVPSEPKTEPVVEQRSPKVEDIKPQTKMDTDNDEDLILKLKDKAKLLQKLGGEIPAELQKIIKEDKSSRGVSPAKQDETSRDSKSTLDTNIDDLLEEIEKKELPKKIKKQEVDMFGDDDSHTPTDVRETDSNRSTPKVLSRSNTPPIEEAKSLFPSAKAITEDAPKSLFPSAANIEEMPKEEAKPEVTDSSVSDKKSVNIYLMDSEVIEKPRKKLRISNSVLPERKSSEVPSYTTKYSTVVDGFGAGERTGLGFSKNDVDEDTDAKKTISYGKGLMFTKGEVLNEGKQDEATDDLVDLLEAKLKFLNEQQVYPMSPVQEMTVQLQTLLAAYRVSALTLSYMRRWLNAAADSLRRLEESAAPPGWQCRFHRSAGRYEYVREDGLAQWEYPAGGDDMDICTTPPPPPAPVEKETSTPTPPKPPVTVPPPPPPPPLPPRTPPPPVWDDPPPPGCDEHLQPPLPPPLPPPPPSLVKEPKKEIGDELMSFYNDIAELDRQPTPPPPAPAPPSPDPPKSELAAYIEQKLFSEPKLIKPEEVKTPEVKTEKEALKGKKKSKLKLSSSMGMKQKTVSNLVAKWQQVAEEIHSD